MPIAPNATVSTPIQQRLQAFRDQKRVQATSLIVTLFGDAVWPRGGRIWLGSLIRLLEPLGLSERLVRTSVFRLVKDDWLVTHAQGRRSDYALSPSGIQRSEEAARHIYASFSPLWDRRWRFVFVVGNLSTAQREKVRQSLFWQGFGAVSADCFVHPSADLNAAFDALQAEGLGEETAHLMPMLAAEARADVPLQGAQLVRKAWNLDQLAADYEQFADTYLPILVDLRRNRLTVVTPEDAFLLRLLLIHDYRRLLLRDPELPDSLLPTHWPGQQARQTCKDLYRRLLKSSEQHLDEHLCWADGSVPPPVALSTPRFPDDDPLASMAL